MIWTDMDADILSSKTLEDASALPILPYSLIVVGQESLKLALELACIAPRLGGVLRGSNTFQTSS